MQRPSGVGLTGLFKTMKTYKVTVNGVTLQQCKDQVAKENGFIDWTHYSSISANGEKYNQQSDRAAELYASQFKEKDEPQLRSALAILQDKFEGLESKINKPNVYQTHLIIAAMEEYASQFKKGDQTEQRFTIEDMKSCWEASEDSWEYDQMIGWMQNYKFDEWIKTRKEES